MKSDFGAAALSARLGDKNTFSYEGDIYCTECFFKDKSIVVMRQTKVRNLYNCPYCAKVKEHIEVAADG